MKRPNTATNTLKPTIAAPMSPIGLRQRRERLTRPRRRVAVDHGAATTDPTSAPSAAATPAASSPGCSSPSGRMMLMRVPRRRRLSADGAGLRRRLAPLAARCLPGPYTHTVPSGPAPRATPEERAGRGLTRGVSFERDPRVEEAVEDVDDQVEEDERRREQHRRRLHERVVAVEDRLQEVPAHTGQAEDDLDDRRAAHQDADLEADD